MQTVYITTPGVTLHKQGETLVAKKDGDTYNTIFPFRTSQVVMFGGVEVTRGAINFLLYHGISAVFLSQNGHYNGQLMAPMAKNIFLRQQQYTKSATSDFGLRFAKSVVKGKVANQRVILGRIKRFQNRDLQGKENRLEEVLKKIDTADNLESLRGYEGLAAKEYFSVFDKGFIKSQGFRVRRRRPPTDPVNAVLSLLYTMLFYRVDNAVERRGLDPYLGHLHAHSYGRRSLVLDLMEEFRPIVVDTLVLSLFNLNIISASDFEYFQNDEETTDIMSTVKPVTALSQPDVTQDAIGVFSEGRVDTMPREYHAETDVMTSLDDDGHDEATGKRAMVLAKPALKKVLEQFENKLDTEFYHERLSARTTYRKAIDEQVDHYADFLRGDVAVYEPLVMR